MKRIATLTLFAAALLPAQTVINGSRTILGQWDASTAASTRPARMGSSLPATCAPGEVFFLTTASPGQNLYACQPANTWSPPAASAGAGAVTISLSGTSGQAACGYLPYNGLIQSAVIAETSVPPVASSAVVDLWIGPYQPTVSNSIVGVGAKPALAGQTNATAPITGWSASFTAGQWICGHLDSVTGARTVVVVLTTRRS